jgi:membrane-bound ClpP family serine protease
MNLIMLVSTVAATGIFSFLESIQTWQAVILVLGIVLMFMEIFTPGFGLAGGSGLALLVLGIILTARTPLEAMVMIVLLIILVAIVLAIILRSAKKGRLSRKLILWSATREEDGYRSTDDRSDLLGHTGVALTILRPAGSAQIGDERLDVVSDGSYIQLGAKIKVVAVEGRRIVVMPAFDE